ncbi:putative sugar ABC transporter substrate-binding protein [Actinoplanes missouriensis 431]|uniref:Putative sugar ABC transporter substrate-binding protein n=1 Tax=Actinoplanes missouriensis (strain ATCC 14538 / DSM 43046 / CBS 188.64 / JCM 3121 / NBRC 102363 / NCIMB 12654 / NRRL B-3342 / UNCC 431) TaxID=512565 RepID=I0HEN3_ACTM4|nr:extracellular solute-binding protein [Actinoplanes missouriensis]BAL91470.1 putative sugar ABC transporter substrate-binding protein [Actinoplanes missouriensis 431]
MRLRLAVAAALALTVTACAPSTSAPAETATDGGPKTGALKVWLFDEPNRAPKEAVVNEAIAEFTASHPDTSVDIQYIAVDTRSERFKGAFNDPASAPDVVEYGNTDLPEYAAAGGLADLGPTLQGWSEGADLSADAKASATYEGTLLGVPWYVGVRALYYRTDVFSELGLKPPATLAELTTTATTIRAKKPEMFGIAVGGKYTYGAMPFVWANGGELTEINSAAARQGLKSYTDLIAENNCPPQNCADLTGGKTVDLFASGKAAMGILGNFNRAAVDAGAAKGKYAVLPLPGVTAGSVAPAFAGGNNLGIMKNAQRPALAADFLTLLAGKKYQAKMYDAMGNLPTLKSASDEIAAKDTFVKPFIDTIAAGTKFVPLNPGWGKVDASAVLPTMIEKVATGKATVDQATDEAAKQIDEALTK